MVYLCLCNCSVNDRTLAGRRRQHNSSARLGLGSLSIISIVTIPSYMVCLTIKASADIGVKVLDDL